MADVLNCNLQPPPSSSSVACTTHTVTSRCASPGVPAWLQALAAQQQQLSGESSLLEQQLVAAAGRRLELVQLRAGLLERLGAFCGGLQAQRQAEVEALNATAAEVGGCGCGWVGG